MYRLALSVLALAAIVTAPAFASGKSPGAYISLMTRDAAACARACADDGLCMAWTRFTTGACELAATVPTSAPTDAADFGLSSRAPAFAQFRARTEVAAQTAPAAVIETPAAPQPVTASQPIEIETETSITAAPDDLVLLGGPEEEDIRLRLGQR